MDVYTFKNNIGAKSNKTSKKGQKFKQLALYLMNPQAFYTCCWEEWHVTWQSSLKLQIPKHLKIYIPCVRAETPYAQHSWVNIKKKAKLDSNLEWSLTASKNEHDKEPKHCSTTQPSQMNEVI